MEKNRFPLDSRMVRDKRAVSPAISTVILTGVIVVLLLVTTVFANNFLDARLAENEFSAMEQFMQTVALQVDDVAWTVGRTQTIRYASKYGHVKFESVALNYSIEVRVGLTWKLLTVNSTGMILFNMPTSKYSIRNNHFELIFPSNSSFVLEGTSAPVTRVFVVEKLPMPDGDYIRIAVAPIMRMLNSTITMGQNVTNYFKIYLPVLKTGQNPRNSQSITITAQNVYRVAEMNINKIRVNVTFPNVPLGFNAEFFNFGTGTKTFDVPSNSVVEVYLGEVLVHLGLHG